MHYFSKSTGGFYIQELHNNMPNDVVAVTEERYSELFQGQSQGKKIVGDSSGLPILVDNIFDNTYTEERKRNYPSIGDQLDMLWHALDTGTLDKSSSFYTTIKQVKDTFPKE